MKDILYPARSCLNVIFQQKTLKIYIFKACKKIVCKCKQLTGKVKPINAMT